MDNRVAFFTHEDYPVDDSTRQLLEQMSEVEGVIRPIVALPDIHFKYSYHTPTGVVVLSKDKIIPSFVNANCGMSFAVFPLSSRDLNENRLDKIFNYLKENIMVTTRVSPLVSRQDLKDIIRRGAAWSIDKFSLNPEDLINFENEGSLFNNDDRPVEEILDFVPKACQNMGLLSMGVLGYGNHFIELESIEKVINKDIAARFGISEGQLCVMIHSDSRGFGQSIFDFYSQRAKKLLGLQQAYKQLHYRLFASPSVPGILKKTLETTNRNLNKAKSFLYWKADNLKKNKKRKFKVIDALSPEGEAYLTATYCAINYGYANRAYLISVLRDALRKTLGNENITLSILHDGNHDCLQKELIDNQEFYVHRNGATRALPPSYFSHHPIFSFTGQPVLLPSSLGNPSYLCAATKGCPQTYYSSCHGTGRLIDRGEARYKFDKDQILTVLKKKMKVYDFGPGLTSEEAPEAFKEGEKILQALTKFNIAEPVAKLSPLAALKGWR